MNKFKAKPEIAANQVFGSLSTNLPQRNLNEIGKNINIQIPMSDSKTEARKTIYRVHSVNSRPNSNTNSLNSSSRLSNGGNVFQLAPNFNFSNTNTNVFSNK